VCSPGGGNVANAFLAPAAAGLRTGAASGLNSGAAAGRRATCASRACSGLKAQAGDGELNILEEYKRRLKEVDETDAKPRVKRQERQDEGGLGGLFSKLFMTKKEKACRTDYDCNEDGRNWPLRCVDGLFAKVNPKPETREVGVFSSSP